MIQISDRLSNVFESATLQLNAAVQNMKAQGIDVVNLTAGEPDFHVAEEVKEAVVQALRENRSKYTPVAGIPQLREAIAQKTNQQQKNIKTPWKASNVLVTNGGKQALFQSFLALLNPGDEVLIPAPYWLSYPEMVKLAGGIPRLMPTSIQDQFKIKAAQLKKMLNPRVKALVINSPSNPTGAMYTEKEMHELAEVILSEKAASSCCIISDEIYDKIIVDEIPFCSFLNAAPELRERCITVNGMSKSAAMTGWRVGWSVAPEKFTEAMSTIQGQSTSGINALAQWASLAALKLPESYFHLQNQEYVKRKNLLLEILQKTKKIELFSPYGGFYLFVGIRGFLRQGEDSIAFCQRILEQARVAAVPGTPFGAADFIRLSFATDEKTLSEGANRLLKEFI